MKGRLPVGRTYSATSSASRFKARSNTIMIVSVQNFHMNGAKSSSAQTTGMLTLQPGWPSKRYTCCNSSRCKLPLLSVLISEYACGYNRKLYPCCLGNTPIEQLPTETNTIISSWLSTSERDRCACYDGLCYARTLNCVLGTWSDAVRSSLYSRTTDPASSSWLHPAKLAVLVLLAGLAGLVGPVGLAGQGLAELSTAVM